MLTDLLVRPMVPADAEAVPAIYAAGVAGGLATFGADRAAQHGGRGGVTAATPSLI